MKRRTFLKRSSLVAAGFTIIPRHVLGGNGWIAPSDRITVGFIGTGRQGRGLGKRFAALAEAQVVAACDVDASKLALFKKEVGEKYAASTTRSASSGSDIRTYASFRELLTQDDMDAVVIATPDYWHAIQSIEAMRAGMDVFCEKPLAHTIQEGRAMVKAAEKYGKIVQTGSMQRSGKNFLHACELVRNGYIGEVKTIKVEIGQPAVAAPCDLPPMDTPKELDWENWIGPAPMRPYHEDLAPRVPEKFWPRWRYYKEFGTGMLGDWGAHMFDIAQWGIGMDHTGPIRYEPPKDKSAQRGMVFTYANGIKMIHEDFGKGNAVRFIGTEGTLDISRRILESDPGSIVKEKIGPDKTRLYKSENHYLDWLGAIKSRKAPICDAEVGHRTASICHIANISYQLGRTLEWDPVKEKFIGDGEANKMRKKKYRKPWKLKV